MIAVEPKIVNSLFRTPAVDPPGDKDDPLYWRLRRENDDFLRRQQWRRPHEQGTLKDNRQLDAQRLSRKAEHWVAKQIRQMGYRVHPTTYKKAFDLWIESNQGGVAKAEVKASRSHRCQRGQRFQANIRHHHTADLVIFVAYGDDEVECWPFVIPMAAVAPRRNIAIWSPCPADYTGQWAPYLEAWDHLHRAVACVRSVPWQPALF